MNNTDKIYQGITDGTALQDNDVSGYAYGSIVVENINNSKAIVIKKDNIVITIGDAIEICNGDKSIKIDGELNIETVGNITIQSNGNIIFKTADGNLFKPNCVDVRPFAGNPHTLCTTIIGEPL